MGCVHHLAAALVFALALAFAPRAAHAEELGAARLLSVSGPIDPVVARYVEREVGGAERDGAALVVVQLDTPGGLDASTRAIVQALLGSRVPVVVFVAPPGARAASAGMFVTLAAGVAAMAPGTEIGAAHPVSVGGGRLGSTTEAKVVHDAAAFARALAELRHRDGAWPERAVRESVSLTSDEAARAGVIDLVAADVPDLLLRLDGRAVPTASGDELLRTAGVSVEERPMLLSERVVRAISDPNVAYVLFLLGLLGIAAELYNPGALVPGTIGAIALVLALVAFGNLPIAWAGILLILLAIGLFVGELHSGSGVLAAAAVAALVIGSLMLYAPREPMSPAAPIRVSPVLVGVMASAVTAFFLLVVRATLRARRLAVQTGVPALVGQVGVATSDLAPAGTVRVEGEVWSAESGSGAIRSGERVKVVGAAGVVLHVTRLDGAGGEESWNRSLPTSS
ncbi:MAG: nodulation protein NfeD [Labilithrix sp.]|nr:nodulation protein NfeD [Labilithrix sp.]MCW5833259.1 nodulation protein NfeD [Labilithrix sp.]